MLNRRKWWRTALGDVRHGLQTDAPPPNRTGGGTPSKATPQASRPHCRRTAAGQAEPACESIGWYRWPTPDRATLIIGLIGLVDRFAPRIQDGDHVQVVEAISDARVLDHSGRPAYELRAGEQYVLYGDEANHGVAGWALRAIGPLDSMLPPYQGPIVDQPRFILPFIRRLGGALGAASDDPRGLAYADDSARGMTGLGSIPRAKPPLRSTTPAICPGDASDSPSDFIDRGIHRPLSYALSG